MVCVLCPPVSIPLDNEEEIAGIMDAIVFERSRLELGTANVSIRGGVHSRTRRRMAAESRRIRVEDGQVPMHNDGEDGSREAASVRVHSIYCGSVQTSGGVCSRVGVRIHEDVDDEIQEGTEGKQHMQEDGSDVESAADVLSLPGVQSVENV